MTTESNSYTPNIMGGMGGMGFGSGGILEGIILASLLGRNGNGLFGGGNGAGTVVAEQNISELRQEVADVKSSIIQDLQQVQADLQAEACESQKEAIKAAYESKIAALQATNEITNKIGNESQAIEGKISAFQTKVDSQFCHVNEKIASSTQTILSQINADKLDSKNDEIAQLRARTNSMEQTAIFSNQFNAINSILASVANQTQHLTNQVVQFGAGNTAIPVATNNQVR